MLTHELKALALVYEPQQDRILAVVNPGLNSWSFWLTRRLVLEVLVRLPQALEATSPMAGQAPAEYRGEVVAFERDKALASTEAAMSHTGVSVLQRSSAVAELAVSLSFTDQQSTARLELRGERGGHAAGALGRQDVQRILHMLEGEVTRAGWRQAPTVASEQARQFSQEPDAKRRLN